MASSLVQFRTEDTSRIKAASICEQLGIDLPTYLRACIARLIQENGIPFSMKLEPKPESKGLQAMKPAVLPLKTESQICRSTRSMRKSPQPEAIETGCSITQL